MVSGRFLSAASMRTVLPHLLRRLRKFWKCSGARSRDAVFSIRAVTYAWPFQLETCRGVTSLLLGMR